MSSSQQTPRNVPTRGRNPSGRNSVRSPTSRPSRDSATRVNLDVDGLSSSLRSLNLGNVNSTPSTNLSLSRGTSVRPNSVLSRVVSQKEIDDYVQRTIEVARPSGDEMAAKRQICVHLQSIARRIVPNAALHIIGGVGNTFALNNSDVDMCIDGDLGPLQLDYLASEFRNAANVFYAGHSTELLRHTYIPLIKLEVRGFGLSRSVPVDISWGNSIGIYKTALLAAYSNVDPRVRFLVLFIKYWSKMRKLTDTRRGGMGSFAWCLLCIHFLMKVANPPVVPNLQTMPKESKYIQGCDVGFSKAITIFDNWSGNTETIGQLVTGFFNFMVSFDFTTRVVSIRSRDEYLTKGAKGWTTDLVRGYGRSYQKVFHSYYIAIEDPFERDSNAARTVNIAGLHRIRAEIQRAVSIFNGNGSADMSLSNLCVDGISYL